MIVASDLWTVDGLMVVRRLLTRGEVDALRALFEVLRCLRVPTTRQVLYTHDAAPARPTFDVLMDQWLNPHLRTDEGSTAHVLSRVRAMLATHFQQELTPFQDVLLSKHAGHRPFPAHQDEPFWPVDTSGGVIVWCALDRVDAENGGIELSRGSHRLGLGPAIDLHTGLPQRPGPSSIPALHPVSWTRPDLEPGDAVLFHSRTWHRSGVNRRGTSRRVWSSSWLPPTARWNPARAPRHPLSPRIEAGAPVAATKAERPR